MTVANATSAAAVRRHEATLSFFRYFVLGLILVGCLSGLTVYSLLQTRAQKTETAAIRMAYCTELEKLKTQNREDLASDRKNFTRNLRLLGITDTTELRKAVQDDWDRKARRNSPKPCPYRG